MRTVVLGPPPAELARIIAQRRALGLDTYDEVWEGDYHMAPAPSTRHGLLQHQVALLLERPAKEAGLTGCGPFNLGEPLDFRVPDLGWFRGRPEGSWAPSAALVVEIESPDDETWQKLSFYARHGVGEVVIVAADAPRVTWLALEGGTYAEVDHSSLIDSGPSRLVADIDWPADPSGDIPTQ